MPKQPRTPAKTTKPFSEDLDAWLKSGKPKTVMSLGEVFAEKSFATIFVVLMALPALPLPTGGLSHVFEVIVILLCLEMLAGRRSIWLPKRYVGTELNPTIVKKGMPYLIKRIKTAERFARPRLSHVVSSRAATYIHATIILVLSVFALTSVPFSGLDTLPALGVVIISLGIILEDILGIVLGTIIGALGVVLILGIGTAIFSLF